MSEFENDNPFMPWNREIEDHWWKPWNNEMHRHDPFTPWNSCLANEKDYEKWCDEHHIPERDR